MATVIRRGRLAVAFRLLRFATREERLKSTFNRLQPSVAEFSDSGGSREQRRLIIDREGVLATYETGDHDIGGVSQADGASRSVEFSSQHGPVKCSELEVVS